MTFSSDSKDDTIASLAGLYRVLPSEIQQVTGSNWPQFVDWEDSTYRPLLPTLMGNALNREKAPYDVDSAAYYHRTRYDGTKDWFSAGLVAARDGATKIIEAMRPYLSNEEYGTILKSTTTEIDRREAASGNPDVCAYDIFEDALRATQSIMNYALPEFS